MDYDFSNIETEELREAFDYAVSEPRTCCFRGLLCDICPIDFCNSMSPSKIIKIISEELNRREKMENKMPELEAGMLVEHKHRGLQLLLPSGDNILMYNGDLTGGMNIREDNLLNIYVKNTGFIYKRYFDDDTLLSELECIWSKKSDNDIKIEEIQETIDKLQKDHEKNISELKQRIEDYKKQ